MFCFVSLFHRSREIIRGSGERPNQSLVCCFYTSVILHIGKINVTVQMQVFLWPFMMSIFIYFHCCVSCMLRHYNDSPPVVGFTVLRLVYAFAFQWSCNLLLTYILLSFFNSRINWYFVWCVRVYIDSLGSGERQNQLLLCFVHMVCVAVCKINVW